MKKNYLKPDRFQRLWKDMLIKPNQVQLSKSMPVINRAFKK